MNRYITLLVIIVITLSCGKKNNFSISGKIAGADGKMIYLNQLTTTNQLPVDSAKLDQNGSFRLKGKVSVPTFFLLKFTDQNFITLLADSTENITISGSYKYFPTDYEVKGSDNSSKVRDLTFRFAPVKAKADSLRLLYRKYENLSTHTPDLEIWSREYQKTVTDYTIYLNGFIRNNPFSMASVYALYQKWEDNNYVANDFQAMKTAASALKAVYPKSDYVKALYNNTLEIIKQQNNQKLNNLISSASVNSPNIKLPDVNGIDRDLWSLQGKVVLLHFWSAKDRTSRIQNQVLAELYSKYKSRGFEIYMVSIDNDKEAWKAAIAEDHLTWINVGDMKGSVTGLMSYNIQTIPSNYLLDKKGTIIAKNLQGPELNATLAKVLN